MLNAYGCFHTRARNKKKSTQLIASIPQSWHELIKPLAIKGLTKELAENCSTKTVTDQVWHLSLAPKKKYLFTKETLTKLSQHIHKLHPELTIQIHIEEPNTQTPSEIKKEENTQKLESARKALLQESCLKKILELSKTDEEKIKIKLHEAVANPTN
ncbi:hypothetical protein MMH89_01350 [Candidatus Comchoanobacter bicostacola]|uniref:DNA polymerase III tau subunit domain-containing protein n=1 Tax=Candidatus Comchoanobacter bicostacola TaxID=2919598 RepID=A0ABY5DJX4_9GAMM|nr:DNA polymerase III subunit gamma/tau C-terminal domain-containing protein [Candidatus Comchoanobacter bicostacola]UTC24798.1 hypothetical protein MMH89_01350 [Candidatus Comchoanobacter bicostacola]